MMKSHSVIHFSNKTYFFIIFYFLLKLNRVKLCCGAVGWRNIQRLSFFLQKTLLRGTTHRLKQSGTNMLQTPTTPTGGSIVTGQLRAGPLTSLSGLETWMEKQLQASRTWVQWT